MSVAGSCFLQWTQKILTINKKLSRYIPLLIYFKRFFYSIYLYDYKVYVTKLSPSLCGNLTTFLRSPSREHSLERSNLFRIFFSMNTFATHEASCNENRFNFRKYYRIFATMRKEGRPQRGCWSKKRRRNNIPFQSYSHRLLADPLFVFLSCAACHSLAFGVERSRFISHD